MAKFFINRPIVAMVISIVMTIVGIITYLRLPVAQFPDIVPPEIQVKTTYTGADALTVEQSVATPIEQQMSGVDNMNYMQSVNGNDGTLKLTVNFEVGTDVNTDQILAQMRSNQASVAVAAGREQVRRHGAEIDFLAADHVRALFAERNLRQRLPGELREHQSERRVHARERHRQRARSSARAIRDAHLGEAGPTGQAWPNDSGNHQRDSMRRTQSTPPASRRRAGAQRPGVHLCRARAGTPANRRRIRRDRGARQSRWLHAAGERCRPHRAGRAELRPLRPA